jgi:hypothetical protein
MLVRFDQAHLEDFEKVPISLCVFWWAVQTGKCGYWALDAGELLEILSNSVFRVFIGP